MTSALGVYWSVMHRRPQDYDYFARLQPSVFKIMDGGPNDYKWAKDNLPNSLIIARDWALSEQHSDMLKDAKGTGIRHAHEWNEHQKTLGFDKTKTLILGINEPGVWEPGVPEALRVYTIALCNEATRLGLRVGAMQLSVGWPANTGPDTPPNWEPFDDVDTAIRANNGALVLHEYWADNGPGENWGWWAGRSLKCPWQVPIVIGECGIDMYVKDGSVEKHKRGWQAHKTPEQYAAELADYTGRMNADSRFKGCAVFAADFAAHEWFSFDIERAYQAILAAPIPQVAAQPQHTTRLPNVVSDGPTPAAPPAQPATVPWLLHPLRAPDRYPITQHFGEGDYSAFGMKGHTGVDYATPVGTVVQAVDDGVVMESRYDAEGYGNYVKLRHTWGESLYAHLLERDIEREGVPIPRGGVVGLSGNTGNSTGPHLHFAMRVFPYTRGWPYDGFSDPLPYLQGTPTAVELDVVTVIRQAAQEFGVDANLLLSQAWAESSFKRTAVSSAGAMGLLQIMPLTWAEWSAKIGAGGDPFDARQNARVGAAYMRWLLAQTQGNVTGALIAYGFGIGNWLNGKPVPDAWANYAAKIVHGRDLLKAVGQ
jgi:murein DD-endopeptidase MepM/ murein hydrolase activator NlpD